MVIFLGMDGVVGVCPSLIAPFRRPRPLGGLGGLILIFAGEAMAARTTESAVVATAAGETGNGRRGT